MSDTLIVIAFVIGIPSLVLWAWSSSRRDYWPAPGGHPMTTPLDPQTNTDPASHRRRPMSDGFGRGPTDAGWDIRDWSASQIARHLSERYDMVAVTRRAYDDLRGAGAAAAGQPSGWRTTNGVRRSCVNEKLLALLAEIQSHQAFRQMPHPMQDRIRLMEREVMRSRGDRAQAFRDGWLAGAAADGGWTDEQLWEHARRYAGS